MSILNVGKEFIKTHTSSMKVLCPIYNFFSFNKICKKGKNNQIIKSRAFLKKCNIKIIGSNNTIDLGTMNYLTNTKIIIYGSNNKIVLGERVYIMNGDLYMEDDKNTLKIMDKTTFAGNVHLALTEGRQITIGKDCLFSSNIVFRTGDSHSILNMQGERINYGKDIEIEDHVWITQNVTILKGAKISRNSICATGSIVTKKFNESNILLAGSPAKKIKDNIDWNRKRI